MPSRKKPSKPPEPRAGLPADLPLGKQVVAGKPAKKRPGRKPGRRERSRGPIGPKQQQEIAELWLQCWSYEEIADKLRIAKQTVQHHIAHNIRPQWRVDLTDRFELEAAKIDHLERIAWRHFELSKRPERHKQIEDAINRETKLPEPTLKRLRKVIRRNADPNWLDVVRYCRDWWMRVGGYAQADPLGDRKAEQPPPIILEVLVKTREEAKQMMDAQDFFKRLTDAKDAKTKQMEDG